MDLFEKLPAECISNILSLTSPVDACRSSIVSSTFRSSAESDLVWESFLPSDYSQLLLRTFTTSRRLTNSTPARSSCSKKKELFFRLCNSVFLDGGEMIFALDRATGLKSYVIAPRKLKIAWGDIPTYWCWKSAQQSRFAEVVELITTSWLEIHGVIDLKLLSPNTIYGAFLIYKVTERTYGLEKTPMEASVCGNQISQVSKATLVAVAAPIKEDEDQEYNSSTTETTEGKRRRRLTIPRLREDGYWMEVELGRFCVKPGGGSGGDDDHTVDMCLKEVKGYHLKGGMIVEGIEVRPVGQS